MKFAPMAIPAMALLLQHDARRDIVFEPAARRRGAIEARGHSELRAFGTGGVRNWWRNRAVKNHRLVTARRNARIARAVLATAIPSVRPSVRPSVTRRCCVKTTACSTVQFALLDSKICLVL